MKITKEYALKLWDETYGDRETAYDFTGRVMMRSCYGDRDTIAAWTYGPTFHVGWNIHHIMPKAKGGTNRKGNLICVNIETNDAAADRTTFQIDGKIYQVKRIKGSPDHEIVRIK